jgi:hypothetical protein
MFERSVFWIVLAGCLWSGRASAEPKDKPKPVPEESASGGADACVEVKASARAEAYGYTHLVTLRNGCDKSVVCEVWTDVDPTPRYTLRARPGETDETRTRAGSPSREVNAQFACHYE